MTDTSNAIRPIAAKPEYPKTVKGRVAQVYGIRAYVDGGWMTPRWAAKLLGVRASTLHKWATAGLMSYRQDEPDGSFRYLREEVLVVTGLRDGDRPLTIRTIRAHVKQKVGGAGA